LIVEQVTSRRAVKIVSGGQTGVDQGALAAALDLRTPCGGWCPAGRKSEDGTIPVIYPVEELAGADYVERTLRNVQDSDGTAIIFNGELQGGTRLTETYCEEVSKPRVLVNAAAVSETQAIAALLDFVSDNQIHVLNVAGPRASKWSGGHRYAQTLITAVLARLLQSQSVG